MGVVTGFGPKLSGAYVIVGAVVGDSVDFAQSAFEDTEGRAEIDSSFNVSEGTAAVFELALFEGTIALAPKPTAATLVGLALAGLGIRRRS